MTTLTRHTHTSAPTGRRPRTAYRTPEAVRRLRTTDLVVILTTILVASAVRWLIGGPLPPTAHPDVALAVLWWVLLAGCRTRRAALLDSGGTGFAAVTRATLLAFGLFAILGVMLRWPDLRLLLGVTVPVGLLAILVGRATNRRWLRRRRIAGQCCARTLVVGDEQDVTYVLRALHRRPESGYRVLGVTLLGAHGGSVTIDGTDYPVLGHAGTVADAARRIEADTVVLAGRPEASPGYLRHLSWQLEGTAAELVIASALVDVAAARIRLHRLDGLSMLHVRIPSFDGTTLLCKRALDVVVSALALMVVALLTPLIALAIRLDSAGPVFFRQSRVGRDGSEFPMYKFRTMSADAETRLAALQDHDQGNGVQFKMRRDPRVTRVGAFLRRTSLDELPQFWNVLRGDMSVVGPRPPLPREVRGYDGTTARRLLISPGITGPWQVGGRSDLSWEQSIRLDLHYVENWSLLGDLAIMARTARAMVRPEGAY